MSQFYTPKRTKNLYQANADAPFKISRSKIDLFLNCPRCFYLDRKLGIGRPPGFPFNLNSAVDTLLKKEFDILRQTSKPHALMGEYAIDALPAKHDLLDDFRNNFKGIRYHHEATNFIIFGAIDDLWINSNGEYLIVDYKSTSKKEKISVLDKGWQISYKRQMEIYQWLFRRNGYKVSSTGYFVYCNGKTDNPTFDAKLEFDITIIPYIGDDSWIDGAINQIYECLNADKVPSSSQDCDFCAYLEAVRGLKV